MLLVFSDFKTHTAVEIKFDLSDNVSQHNDNFKDTSNSRHRSLSESSGSSEEIIVFRGRNQVALNAERLSKGAISQENDLLAESIANVRASRPGFDGNDSTFENQSGDKRPIVPGEVLDLVSRVVKDKENLDQSDGWGSVELQDFDNISTSSEPLDTLAKILGKRTRKATVQYLVISKEVDTDLARWVPVERMNAPNATDLIDQYEQRQKAREEIFVESNEGDEDRKFFGNGQVSAINSDSAEDNKDLEERRKTRISDEQIARLITKQVELGMPGDELLLFNGEGFATESTLDGEKDPGPSRRRPSKRLSRPNGRKSKDNRAIPQWDELDGDDYGDFDIMDQERPSLQRPGKKGPKSEDLIAFSDDELMENLATSWANDRRKKKMRKQEREQLRAQGLLTGRDGKPDLKTKYRDGISITELKSELREFLKSQELESLALPPMPKLERRTVHSMAEKLGLQSKSRGNGTSRFTVLLKPSSVKRNPLRSLSILEMMSLPKNFLPKAHRPRRDNGGGGGGSGGVGRRGGAGGRFSYMEGEVVGMGAPELGQENRGHAMLQKMGWTTGMALGADNNKGISEPVAQVIKNSRAGLG